MTKEEAKRILAAYRPGDEGLDSSFAEALQEIGKDPELARWLAEEREFDRAVAAHLNSVPVPFALKTRVLANMSPRTATKRRWLAPLAVAGIAALSLLALII